MPYYKHMEVGDFDVEIKPIGRWRSKWLIKQLAPYFAGNQPKFKITIKKRSGITDEMKFDAGLWARQPDDVPNSNLMDVGSVYDIRTPFEWNIEIPKMLRTNGNHIYELSLDPKQQDNKAKIIGRSVSIAQILVMTREVIFMQMLFIIVGILLGLIPYFISLTSSNTN